MTFLRVVFLTLSQNYRTRRRPPLAKTRPWAGSRLGSGRGPGTSSGVRRRVRPRPAEVRHQGLADQQHQPGVRHGPAGVRPPSGRIRRGLGTRVLLTCLGPADPRYWGGSSPSLRAPSCEPYFRKVASTGFDASCAPTRPGLRSLWNKKQVLPNLAQFCQILPRAIARSCARPAAGRSRFRKHASQPSKNGTKRRSK